MTAKPYPESVDEKTMARIEAKIDRSDPGRCWIWRGAKNNWGYGLVRVGGRKGRVLLVHRLLWVLRNGNPSDLSLQLDHHIRCVGRHCANPGHLRLSTHSENMWNRRMQKNNTSGVRGVCWDKSAGRWKALVKHHGKRHSLGYFTDIRAAELAAIEGRIRFGMDNDSDRSRYLHLQSELFVTNNLRKAS